MGWNTGYDEPHWLNREQSTAPPENPCWGRGGAAGWIKLNSWHYLHHLGSQLLTLGKSLTQHGLSQLDKKADQTSHAISSMCRGRYQGHKSAGILILIKQSCIQPLDIKAKSLVQAKLGRKVSRTETTSWKLDEQWLFVLKTPHQHLDHMNPGGINHRTEKQLLSNQLGF